VAHEWSSIGFWLASLIGAAIERPRCANLCETQTKTVAAPVGKLNAIRAAFKAGVTPSQIARELGLSQSDVRKALRADKATR
jgi:hypothetical protein